VAVETLIEVAPGSAREWEVLAEVALAMLLGGVVGAERELAGKPAGFRTHMLVAGAAALLVGLAFSLVSTSMQSTWTGAVTADPIRILQAIIIGVGFLGGGTIVRDRSGRHVEGLTTAASLLMASGIGAAVALRQFVLAVGVAVLVAVVLRALGILEARLRRGAD
jgi:putative Mg2+ transporter-C (MgtC) family protein